MEKTSGAITGYKRAVRSFPLSVELDTVSNGRPTRCNSTLGMPSIWQKSIVQLFGGTPDPVSQDCNATANQCPTGTGQFITDINPDGSIVCQLLGGDPHSPEDRNCFLRTTYRASAGNTEWFSQFVINTSDPKRSRRYHSQQVEFLRQ